jgi:hypothetical protein
MSFSASAKNGEAKLSVARGNPLRKFYVDGVDIAPAGVAQSER